VKPIYKSKTAWIAVGIAALGVLEHLQQIEQLPPWALTVIGAIVLALRYVTTGPVGLRGDDAEPPAPGPGPVGFIIAAVFTLSACGTVNVSAKTSAHCKIKRGPPHLVECTVDGDVRYRQTGPQALKIACPE